MSITNFSIAFSDEFETTRMALFGICGVLAVSANLLFTFFTFRQRSALSSEYIKVLLFLKILHFVCDIHSCLFFMVSPLFPCKGIFMKGVGVKLGMTVHISLVINLTLLCMIAAWFNCCLFHRHQVIMPFSHPIKLQPRGIYSAYFIMNTVMIINPISFIFTTKDDEKDQRPAIADSPMAWLLDVPSYKLYTQNNTPLLMTFHFPLTMVTFALCTLTTVILTRHAAAEFKVLAFIQFFYPFSKHFLVAVSRRDEISAATIVMQQRLISSLEFQMRVMTVGMGAPIAFFASSLIIGFTMSSVTVLIVLFLPLASFFSSLYAIVSTKSSRDVILDVLRIRKRQTIVAPLLSVNAALTVTPRLDNS